MQAGERGQAWCESRPPCASSGPMGRSSPSVTSSSEAAVRVRGDLIRGGTEEGQLLWSQSWATRLILQVREHQADCFP